MVPVENSVKRKQRRSVRGALAHLGPAPSWEDFEAASEAAAADLAARYGTAGGWEPPPQ